MPGPFKLPPGSLRFVREHFEALGREAEQQALRRGGAIESAFRLPTGEVVRTGPFHDLTKLPPGWEDRLDELEQGFATPEGRFFRRGEATEAPDVGRGL